MSKLKYSVSMTDCVIGLETSIPMRGDFPALFKEAAEMGFDAVEVNVANPDKYDINEINRCLRDNGLVCSGGLTGLSLTKDSTLISEDPVRRQIAIDKLKKFVDFMTCLKGTLIIGTYRSYIPVAKDPRVYVDMFRESVCKVAEYAQKNGCLIVLEAVNMYYTNYLNSVREMTRFVRELNLPNVKVHLDSSHAILHDVDIYTRIVECGKDLRYVHLSDSDRYACGTGNINFAEYIRGLRDINYQDYCTVEVVPYPNGKRAAEVSLKYLKALEECYEMRYIEKPTNNFPRAFPD